LIDAVYMDIKAPLTKEEYSRVAGVPVDMRAIKASIALLKSARIEVVFRTTVIPGLVQEAQLAAIRSGLGDVRRFIVQPFKGEHAMDKGFRTLKEFGARRMDEMRAAFEVPVHSEYLPQYAAAG
jgi:pyruvate formate lyase activating enzyme